MRIPLPRLSEDSKRRIVFSIDAIVAAYLLGLAAWLAAWLLVGDATWWLFTVNALALHLFVPLPTAFVASTWRRQPALIAGSSVAVVLFAVLWGGLFWPNGRPEPKGPVLTVMTYNVLGHNPKPEGVIEALLASDADVIGLLELSPEVAAAIERDLIDEYPYQVMIPKTGVSGTGVISRLPFRPAARDLEAPGWISPPVVVEVEFRDERFVFVHVHAASGSRFFREREEGARVLSELANREPLPLVVAGDFNASDLNDSYGTLTEHLRDAWREAGDGFGNTFPGASQEDWPGSSRPDFFGIHLPKWLVRIDYVFLSDQWQAVDARLGPWDGHSDHRPVIAEIALREES